LKIYLLYALLLGVGCRDTSNTGDKDHKFITEPDMSNYDSLRQKILGKWGGIEGPPGLDIREDSIYYYQLNVTRPYFFKGDTLLIKFLDRDTIITLGKIMFDHDTLIWEKQGVRTYAYRYKGN
jgi:hypothetical protein